MARVPKKELVFRVTHPGLTLTAMAQACGLSLQTVQRGNPAISMRGTLAPGTAIALPADAHCNNLQRWGAISTVAPRKIAGALHRQDAVRQLRTLLTPQVGRLPRPAPLAPSHTAGAPTVSERKSCAPSHQTPEQYLAFLLRHLGPTEENFFDAHAPMYKKGALFGLVTRLRECLSNTDESRLSHIARAGYDAAWLANQDAHKPNLDDSTAGFITGYAWCAQSYIDGFREITPSDTMAREYLEKLLLQIETEISTHDIDCAHVTPFPAAQR